MEMKKNTVLLHLDIDKSVAKLSMEQRGIILTAIFAHGCGKDLPDMDEVTDMAWSFIRTQIDRENERWKHRAEKNKAAAEARWAKTKKNRGMGREYTEDQIAEILKQGSPFSEEEDAL